MTGLGQSKLKTAHYLCGDEKNADLHAVGLGNGADVMGGSNSASDGCLLAVIGEAFSGEVGGTTLGDLQNNRCFDVAGCMRQKRGAMLSMGCLPGGFNACICGRR